MDEALWIALRDVSPTSRTELRSLVEKLGDPAAIFARLGIDPSLGSARAELERARSLGLRLIPQTDPGFPARLLEISDPPLLLYVAGRLPPDPLVSIVGSRRATERGREAASRFAGALARAGVGVVSGLAYGIDAAAHQGALDAGGRTVAILAGGLDRPGPRGNVRLARRILRAGGAWLSEHPPGTPARPHHFPDRNRLISGVSQAVIVIEAREASGTLWTSTHAIEQDRPVLVVPGPIDSAAYRGSNRLLAEGAKIVLDPVDAVKVAGGLTLDPEGNPPLPPGEMGAIVRRVRDEPCGPDDLVRDLGIDAARLAAILLDLELEGWVVREGRRIAARPKAGKNGGSSSPRE